jgi:FtsH-binding integral membrane protein
MFTGIVATLGGLIGAMYTRPIYIAEVVNGYSIFKTENPLFRKILFGIGIMGLGLSAAPLFAYASAISPQILPTSMGIATAIFGGASLMAYNMPKDKMLNYGGVLTGSLLGLIGLQLTGLLAGLIMGPNMFTYMLFRFDTYIGIALFTAFTAYDTHVAIKNYE